MVSPLSLFNINHIDYYMFKYFNKGVTFLYMIKYKLWKRFGN